MNNQRNISPANISPLNISPPNIGIRSRTGTRGKKNDDAYTVFEVWRPDLQETVYIAVVADGITSHAAGAEASRITVETIHATLLEPPRKPETISEWLEFAIIRANEEILFEIRRNPDWAGMSTTVVLAALVLNKLYILHLGDSRAYLWRSQTLYQLTDDHTWTQQAVNAGGMTADEATVHPGRNQLVRYLGTRQDVSVDRGIILPGTNYHEEFLQIQAGDTILLCSDGLYSRVSQHEIGASLTENSGYPQDTVDELIEKARLQGERDDITAVAIEISPGRKEPITERLPQSAPIPPINSHYTPTANTRSSSTNWVWLIVLALLTIAALYFLILSS